MKTALLLLGLCSFLNACGTPESISSSHAIIGDNDLSPYPFDDYFARAIGKTRAGCTVVHIGRGVVLTAGHCMGSNYCQSNALLVNWGVTKANPGGSFSSKCIKVLSRNYGKDSDYAILQYAEYPDSYLDINLSYRPYEGEPLIVYSHPKGEVLQSSGWCEHLGEHEGSRFRYACDTSKGSSGAPVFNRDYEIVGVHNLGKSDLGFNAGTYLLDADWP